MTGLPPLVCQAAATTRSDEDYEQAMIDLAQGYQGYERIAADSEHLQAVYGPTMDETDKFGDVPGWVGVDLLRGWAFYVARAYRWSGGYVSIFEKYPVFEEIAEAVRHHPAAEPRDMPPARRR